MFYIEVVRCCFIDLSDNLRLSIIIKGKVDSFGNRGVREMGLGEEE